MTIKETAKLLAMLKAYNYKFDGDAQIITSAWHHILKEYDYKVAEVAVINFVKTDRGAYIKFPKPGDIIEQIELITQEFSVDDLWQALVKAVKNCHGRAKEAFNNMPDACKRFTGSPQELKMFSMMNGDTFFTVTRGQFYKQIPNIIKRQKVQNELPKEIKAALNSFPQIGGTSER